MKSLNFKKLLCVLLCGVVSSAILIQFSGCNKSPVATADEATKDTLKISTADQVSTADEAVSSAEVLEQLGFNAQELGINPNIYNADNKEIGFQLEQPQNGDTVAILHTSMGDITMRFFPDEAPKTVTNFINLAKGGGYDNTTFYRVINDFMIQGGDANQASSYGADFNDEFCDKLYNIRGAVAMANNSADSNSSQFFINQKNSDSFETEGGWSALELNWENIKTQLINYKGTNLISSYLDQYGASCYDTDLVPAEVRELYTKYGGNAHLDGAFNIADRGHTVFGQVISGMEVVDKIAAASDQVVTIKNVEISTFSAPTPTVETTKPTETQKSETTVETKNND
ncbi:MAG: peptidylprolyl isomerase [Ruminococcus sp.]|nr:peptidylprolyl isomerase [Ruminococcus sp.]